jgi:glycosyltransferase involved in cell wall biosynthesis
MKILMLHSFYQRPGGEDRSFASEVDLLRDHGHDVDVLTIHNDDATTVSPVRLAARAHWSRTAYRSVRDRLRRSGPVDVVHVQNTFPMLSPSVLWAARHEGAAVVQTLRNYRLMCVNGLLFRDEKPCEACIDKAFAWPGVQHACYRDSRAASATVASMHALHRAAGTWTRAVDALIALSEFAKSRYVSAGFDADTIHVKPNFVTPDPGVGSGEGGYALYVGRLSPEKGLRTLLDAWSLLDRPVPLRIVGDGPLAADVEQACRERPETLSWLGHRDPGEVMELLGRATLLVFPSEWYETFGRVAIEAFARGTPVVASDIGAIAELIEDGVNGRRFVPGDARSLAREVTRFLEHPDQAAALRDGARRSFEDRYSAGPNHDRLREIYRTAIARNEARSA